MDILPHLLITFLIIGPCVCATWDYKSKDTWGNDFPDCAKNSQSPINIVRDDAEVDKDLPIIDRKIFDAPPTRMTVENNGHIVKIAFNNGGYELVDTDLLPFKVKIDHYHFHWGRNASSGGAEHTVDGKRFFGELHAVHYNTKYANVGEAMKKSDGLAVFGWFIDVDYPQKNQDFELLLNLAMSGASKPGNATEVPVPFSLETLVPADLTKYYRYKGSLTTPGCYESVVWTVFEEPIRISIQQANLLSDSFSDDSGNSMQDNFRAVQPLNGRQVTKPPALVKESAAVTVTMSTLLLLSSVVLAMLY